jgi:fructose/tagatose bisphosphate aldolase
MARAIAGGIRKVNLNTELRERWFEAVGGAIAARRNGWDVLSVERAAAEAIELLAAKRLSTYRRMAAP